MVFLRGFQGKESDGIALCYHTPSPNPNRFGSGVKLSRTLQLALFRAAKQAVDGRSRIEEDLGGALHSTLRNHGASVSHFTFCGSQSDLHR